MGSESGIFITGMGVVSPIGIGLDSFWHSLKSGRSGVTLDPRFANLDVPWKISARVDDFDGKRFVKPRKALKVMCREIQFGYVAATLAIEQSTGHMLPEHCFPVDRLACVFGAEPFQGDPEELISAFQKCQDLDGFHESSWGSAALSQIQPLWMLKYLPNMAASHISIAVDARGPNNTICQGDVSGVLAIIEGADLIRRGWADAAIVGATSSRVSPVGMAYRGSKKLSRRWDRPDQACRPFALDRDGCVHGEGAGAVLLESAHSCAKRNAPVLAELLGWSRGFAEFGSADFPSVLRAVALQAMTNANVDISQIGHINANAGGCIDEDHLEAMAIHQLNMDVPVVAFKSNFGQLGPSSGVVETIGSILSLQNDQIPAVAFDATQGIEAGIRLNRSAIPAGRKCFLKISFASTGQIAALVIRR